MFLAQLVGLMLAPILVELSGEFHSWHRRRGWEHYGRFRCGVGPPGPSSGCAQMERGDLHSHLLLEAADGVYVLIRRLWIACRE